MHRHCVTIDPSTVVGYSSSSSVDCDGLLRCPRQAVRVKPPCCTTDRPANQDYFPLLPQDPSCYNVF